MTHYFGQMQCNTFCLSAVQSYNDAACPLHYALCKKQHEIGKQASIFCRWDMFPGISSGDFPASSLDDDNSLTSPTSTVSKSEPGGSAQDPHVTMRVGHHSAAPDLLAQTFALHDIVDAE